MRREDFSFNSEDGLEIAYYRWRAPGKAAGIVQIAHGMGEHSFRYAHLAEFLNQAGFHVYCQRPSRARAQRQGPRVARRFRQSADGTDWSPTW